MNVLVIQGSLREKSINKGLANAMLGMLPEGMTMELAGVSDIPLFNEDLELTEYPERAKKLKEKIKSADGVLFVTPEYNRGMPGALKNAIDWVSRPDGERTFSNKPVGVLGASSGARGAQAAQYDLKRAMMYFGAHIMGQPEFYVDNSDGKIDENGVLLHEKTKEYLRRYLAAFKAHVEIFSAL
jgi:chromate reductase